MPMYDSLLLSQGGGIVDVQKLSPRYPNSAALIIGIGGTGMRAVRKLKQKVYQQIQPEHPDDDVKRYDHIQFLVIDSDATEIKEKGESCIDGNTEFCNISDSLLADRLTKENLINQIKDHQIYNWFDIDNAGMAGTDGAGGIRQVGRFLFFHKFNIIKSNLEAKMRDALSGQNPANLDIYVFAGISGGTGSGTFLDTCYLLRSIVSSGRIACNAKIFGMFFLPDVPMSIDAVADNPHAVAWNTSNGYAAMKELDYLMHLKEAGKRFSQNYGSLTIDTDEKPVDMCHLFSAHNADGVQVVDGFNVALNAATDLAISYLCDTNLTTNPNGVQPQTIRGSMANIDNGVSDLKPTCGADLTYHIVGVSEAFIPTSQFLTYLACGLFKKFSAFVGHGVNAPSMDEIKNLAQELGYGDASSLKSAIEEGSPVLYLSNYADDTGALLGSGVMGRTEIVSAWRDPAQRWLEGSTGTRDGNASMILRVLRNNDKYNIEKSRAATGSLVERTFTKLCDIAANPNYGPYYTALLLRGGEYMLQSCLIDIKAEAEHAAARCKIDLEGDGSTRGLYDYKVDANTAYCSSKSWNRKKRLEAYYCSVIDVVRSVNEGASWRKTAEVAQSLITQLETMYNEFFGPLADCFDTLLETFRANDIWLGSAEARRAIDGTTHLVDLDNVRNDLQQAVDNLTTNECVTDLVNMFINNRGCWMGDNEPGLKRAICEHIRKVRNFGPVIGKTIDTYLMRKYPDLGQDAQVNGAALIQRLQTAEIQRMYNEASPMFWAQQAYNIRDSEVAFPYCNISIPAVSNYLSSAATAFAAGNNAAIQVKQTGLSDRISIIRYYSGVPFYAYHGVATLKSGYDDSAAAMFGVGAHLYAHTGRGGEYDCDWRHELPTPMPYSVDKDFYPDGEDIKNLYDEGFAQGVIRTKRINARVGNPDDACFIYYSDNPDLSGFVEGKCLGTNGKMVTQKYDTEHDQLVAMLTARKENPSHNVELKSGARTDSYDNIRIDTFFHYRRYQDLVRNELAARKALTDKIAAYEAFKNECNRFDRDMKQFVHALFMGEFACLDVQGTPNSYTNYLREVQLAYVDNRGVQQTVILAAAGDEGIFSAYPLYRAFESYRNLPTTIEPRYSLDAKTAQHFAGHLRAGIDNRVAYTLACYLTPMTLGQIDQDSAQTMSLSHHDALMQFYTGLKAEINAFSQLFTPQAWATGGVIVPGEEWAVAVNQASATNSANVPAPACTSAEGSTPAPVTAPGETNVPAPASVLANKWACTCGYADNTRNFCANCGRSRADGEVANGWICPSCHTRNTLNFCPDCGAQRPNAHDMEM